MSNPVPPVLHRVVLAGDDFERAGEFAAAAQLHPAHSIEHEALVHNAVIFYARPFSNNEGPKSKLPIEARTLTGVDLSTILGERVEFHERILTLRNKLVAHAEAQFFPAQLGQSLTLGNPGTRGFTMVRRSWHIIDEQLDLNLLEQISNAMKKAAIALVYERARDLGLLQTRAELPSDTE